MSELNEKDLEQATGGTTSTMSFGKKTCAEYEQSGLTKHAAKDGMNCKCFHAKNESLNASASLNSAQVQSCDNCSSSLQATDNPMAYYCKELM